jgi:preprotein translocase subunit YajC
MTVFALQMGGGMMALLIQMVLIFGIIYVLIILPQRREQKRHREMVATLDRGDQVATTGGLVGEIVQVRDDLLYLKTGDARVVVERARIAHKIVPADAAPR